MQVRLDLLQLRLGQADGRLGNLDVRFPGAVLEQGQVGVGLAELFRGHARRHLPPDALLLADGPP